ncbi:unnamed protein product [Mytilus coruscus]|uniref:C-type lectin domain-containing protein n=1 Tax=Mytilus coruscus TaxID=42192 RepID=A0A6J8ACK3_MYTCO|nr:unnamed protein product [Mytilus coruscus]
MLYFSVFVLPVKWYKSTGVGTNSPSEVMFFETARSKVECSVMCNTIPGCQSYLFDIKLTRCTLLSMSNQQGPISASNDILHYKRCSVSHCPYGYDILSESCACVKYIPDSYRTWIDSRQDCIREGADLAVLNSDTLYTEFLDYMDNALVLKVRVAVNGVLVGSIPYWNNGQEVNSKRFCTNCPDLLNQTSVCLYMTDLTETWCGSTINRLDDALCDDALILRICMKRL